MIKYLKKALLLGLILIVVPACSNVDNTPSQQSSELKGRENVIEDSNDESKKEDIETVPVVSEEPQLLSDADIRVVMDNFQEIEDIVKETNNKLTFSDEEITQPEVMATKLQENLPESLQDLVSNNMQLNQLPSEISYWYVTSGEDGFFPEVSLDARMDIVENTPDVIRVKTFEFNDFFHFHGNVYITAVNENGKWLIDGYEWVDVDKEPLDLSKEEVIRYEETVNDSEIEFIAEEVVTSPINDGTSKTANAIIVKIHKDNTLKGRFTDTGEVVNILPQKFKSTE